jgi:peptidoglycan hydrolase-like amidase
LWFQGRPALTYYSRDCGRIIEAGSDVWPGLNAPYLRRQGDPWCGNGGDNRWTAHLVKPVVWKALHD